jgi:AcrR family transcriptional regulator
MESARARAMNDTRNRILDVALDVLGQNPDAGMGDIAVAAGVVRRTVYGHFPTRADLVRTLAGRAVDEMTAVLTEVDVPNHAPDVVWVAFVARLWPLAHRYRVLVALRRGEYGDEIHGLLGPVDDILASLVQRGQESGVFGRHLPAGLLVQIAYAAVFSIAEADRSAVTSDSTGTIDARAATITSLLILGVSEARTNALVGKPPH